MRPALRSEWRLLLLVFVVGCSGGAPPAGVSLAGRVGVVDVERAFRHSPLLLAVTGRLSAQFRVVQGDIKGKGRKLAILRKRLLHPGAPLAPDARAKLEAEIQQAGAELRALQSRYRTERDEAHRERGAQAAEEIRRLARIVAEERGLAVVVERGAIVYPAKPDVGLDVTDDVIRKLLGRPTPEQKCGAGQM